MEEDYVVQAVLFAPGIMQLNCMGWLLKNKFHGKYIHSLQNGGLAAVQFTRAEKPGYEYFQNHRLSESVRLILYRKSKDGQGHIG